MNDTAQAARTMARLMRETADLIERGLVQGWEVDIEFGHVAEPDFRTGRVHTRATGERTVHIKLYGNDFQQADWSAAAGSPRGQLSNDPKRLTRG